MKLSVKRTGSASLWALLFILGGMFLAVESSAQTTQATYMTPAPSGKTWVSNSQALSKLQLEIALLTNQLNQLIQQNAAEATIGKKKTELQFHLFIQQNLNAGAHVSWAIQEAYAKAGGVALTDGGGQHPYMTLAELEAMKLKATTLLTV